MKSALEHFSTLHLVPPKLRAQSDCRKAIISLLPLSCVAYISQIFVKNGFLYVCVNHEGVVFDLDYKLKSVKSEILQTLKNMDYPWQAFEKIRVYYKQEQTTQVKPLVKRVWTEKERSSGEFENLLQNETLHKLAEEIRELICKNT
jgi:hypothetical protein